MTKARILMIGTAFAALAATGAQAQTAQPMQAAPGADAQISTQAQQPMTPPQQNIVAPAPTDPLVQKRNADAQANAEYKASKKASKAEMKAAKKEANAQYKEEVRNAKINKKADKAAAKDELNAAADRTPKDEGEQH
ncbi:MULTISPECIES: hypothetical protein [unclassified Caballeronia]|uniref:hypothetical protein n=1 Tax=unclassified Caballeronia TaxID=2646786 RepID=UPI00285D2647|nr:MULTISPECIES: hypothetical protein [unclassified Caballeronia]MDR5737830.1 hypothetical protein [Caballeronia sp. LZ016]MDR5809634.1 hypothetical protein [Caballeronia sp. LZ019]